MNHVSDCCKKSTETIRRIPKDPEYQHMSEIATICSQCRKDCNEISACDNCGEPGELTRIGRNDFCPKCTEELQQFNPEVEIA